jgi:hypothetical protein
VELINFDESRMTQNISDFHDWVVENTTLDVNAMYYLNRAGALMLREAEELYQKR